MSCSFLRPRQLSCTLFFIVAMFRGAMLAADPQPDSIDRDYSSELPRIPGKSPEEAMQTFHVVKGFRIEQAAAEPLVTDPVAMAFDENGRLYVVEMRDYSEDDKANLGRVRLLEDTNDDGRFDKSTIFVDGLSWPTAVACWDGGVFVAAAPEFFYFKDTDGDGKADQRQHAFTGFKRTNVQGLLNSLQWGLDNRIYGATSSSGAEVVRPEVKAAAGEKGKASVSLRGRDFALEPRSMKVEATSGGAQHGLSLDNWGRRFVCSNSDHLQQVMFEDRYVARNPYLAPPSSRLSIASDGPQADVFRTSPAEPWRIVRTRLRAKGITPGLVEGGGRASGYFTSATGVTIYRGDAWPDEYRGWAIVGDVGGNLIHRKKLEPNGIPLVGHRVDEKTEFITSDDIWFRPVQFANGPDGALYVADMYRETIEHPASIPPLIKKHLDLTSGRDRGRIYRIVPEKFTRRKTPKFGSAATAELVATLEHANGWHRDTASRLLYQRQDRSAIPALEKLAISGKSAESRLHALYALDGMGALSEKTVLAAIEESSPRIREHAVRLAERGAADSPTLATSILKRVTDDDLLVRYQTAFSLGALHGAERNAALAQLAESEGDNKWLALAIRSSLAEGAGDVLARLGKNASFSQSPTGREWLRVLSEQIGRQQRADDIEQVTALLKHLTESKSPALLVVLQGLSPKAGSKFAEQVAAATSGKSDALTKEFVAAAAKTAVNSAAKLNDRLVAIQTLRIGRFADAKSIFATLLEPAQPGDVQTAAVASLGSFSDRAVAELLVSRWKTLGPKVRTQAAEILFSRADWLPVLLDGVTSETIALADIDPSRWKPLANHRDPAVKAAATAVLAKLQLGKRGDVVEAYRESLTMKADAARGKEHFKKICAACHRVENFGHPTGPNIAAMKNRGAEAILVNVLDPNREVNPQYLNYIVSTTDGRTLSGMITAESATSVTLKRADNATDTVLRIDIDELRSSGLSLMPEGMEKQLDKQALADVIEYLKSLE